MYLEPWHVDVFGILELRKDHGKEEQRARDRFYALWIPDLLTQCVKDNGEWPLFDLTQARDAETSNVLMDVWACCRPSAFGIRSSLRGTAAMGMSYNAAIS